MNKRTKMILSILGASAIIFPAVLLILLSKKTGEPPQISSENRSIDTKTIEEAIKKIPKEEVLPLPSSPSASVVPLAPASPILESTSSGQ